jgi:hypothetical protein
VSDLTSPAGPPAEITHLVRERTEARARHDWPKADELKAQIEAAGWRVVDRGSRTSVSPAAPATVAVDGEVRYGAASAVPSLLAEPATAAWTVVVLASEQPDRLSRLLAGLRAHAPAGTQVVVVANDPSDAQTAALAADAPDRAAIAGEVPEVLRTSTRLGYAAALNIALQRAGGGLVLLTDATAWPTGDALSPLAAALKDPDVAAAGGFGLYSAASGPIRPGALTREPGAEGPAEMAAEAAGRGAATADDAATDSGAATAEATALEGAWLAFRRSDYIELGPLDEHFVTPAWLDVWWTLRLRAGEEPEGAEYVETADADESDEPADVNAPGGQPADARAADGEHEIPMPAPRRAVRLALPLSRDEVSWPPDRVRLNRRNMYRVLDRFGWRDDLA